MIRKENIVFLEAEKTCYPNLNNPGKLHSRKSQM
jgi:hypothetical protein